MNKNVNSPKDINEYKIVVPMSNEAVNKIKSNITKSILGVSIAGVMIAGAATQVKAETVENPTAIVQEAKEEVRTQYDQEIASILKSNSSTEDEEVAELKSATVNLADETSEESESASEEEAITEDKGDISLKDFIADDSLNKFFDFDKIEKEEEKLEISEEKPAEAQKAEAGEQKEDKNLQKADDLNYANDEKNVGDYRQSDLQPGNVNQELLSSDEKQVKDGFKFEFENPSEDSPSKTEYGYQITIDKKTGQRTYTKITVTDGGRVPAPTGEKPMMGQGEKLTTESPDVTYQPTENSTMDSAGVQRNLNYVASEDTLKHINNKDNPSTSFGMKDDYTTENPRVKFFGDNFSLGYKVNPWPNENDKLQIMELKGTYNDKVFVQGQDINTGVEVTNVDENAKERLVGQIYHPETGEVVPGARAYIGDDNKIHIQMPKGALKKNAEGKYVVDKESIFSKTGYQGLQNLDVKFFARPRTAEEFKSIAETPDDFGETGTYTGSGAGTGVVNHKGTDVTIDKQGIDRYDHYNLIGKFKLNLDDTKYYNQNFKDQKGDDTSEHTSSSVKPGQPFKVEMYTPKDPSKIDKTADEMDGANIRGEASGKLILDFINKENKGKAEKDQWKVEADKDNISKFTIIPPKSASAGDFVAIPVEYTYTNGSKDVHWFHFVVQESDNYKPEYHAKIGYNGDTLTNVHEVLPTKDETEKNLPKSYELVMPEDGSNYKDSAGNEWTDIKVDSETGTVTATVPKNADIKGGENLFVDVKVNYKDEKTGEAKEEIVKAQFIARPKYQQEVSKTLTSKVPFETKVIYDDTLEIGKVVKTEGRVGETETSFKQVVINGEKGIINEKGEFEKDKEAVEVKTTIEKVDAEIRIGTKPAETTVTIPPDTDYETSDSLEKGTMQLKEAGEEGLVTVTTSRNPETGEISTTKKTTKEAKKKKMLIGTKTEGTIVHEGKIPFDYEFIEDSSLKAGEQVVVQEGKEGVKKTTYTIENSQVVGEPKVEETAPQKAIIRVGSKKFTGETSHEVTEETKYLTIVEEDDTLPVGETQETQKGVRGSKIVKYTQKFENGVPGEITEEIVSEKPAVNRIIKVGTKTVTEHISKEITEEIPYGVKIEYDNTMPAGKTRVKTKGEAGSKTTEYYRNLINGKFDGDLNTREVTDKYKAPVDEVILVGTKVETNNEEYKSDIKVEIEKVEDPDLYKGIVNQGELTPGKVERKIVNKYDPETGKITTEEEVVVTPAKQKIIIGTKDFTGEFTHTIEKTLPFEREIQYDDNMEAGTQEVTQKGQAGQSEQTITQKYRNGVLADKEFSKVERTKEPVKEIVKIGTKPVEKIVEIPFNTEYVYDNTIDAGTIVEDKNHMGEAGSVKVKTYFDKELGKFVSVEDETSKVGPVNKIVRVGTKPNENMCPAPEYPSNPVDPDGPYNPYNPGEDDGYYPGGGDSDKEGEKNHENPTKPGAEDSEKPGEEDKESSDKEDLEKTNLEEAGNTGEEKPGQPGEDTPSEPGSEEPGTPGTEEPGTTENPEAKTEIDGEDNTGKKTNPNEITESVSSGSKTLPKTGGSLNASLFGYLMGVLGSGFLGLGALKKKKEDEEDEEN